MNRPGFTRYHHLNPTAQEFFPTAQNHIYYPYPPPVYIQPQFPTLPPPAYVSESPPPAYVSEPPPPLPVCLPKSPNAPSRTLLLSMVSPSVSESTVRRDLEIFGDVRAVQMERRRQGLLTVHFYDVRDSQAALVAIQQQHMQHQFRIGQHYDAVFNNSMGFIPPPPPPSEARGLISGRVVWAQFVSPVTAGLPEGNNQGTLVLFNLDSSVSANRLQEIFEAFGPVKELRETPQKRNQRFIEFYDIRNAAMAMSMMNGKEIFGKTITIDFSRPGGPFKKFAKGSQTNGKTSPQSSRNSPSTSPQGPSVRKQRGRFVRSRSDGSKSSSSNESSFHGSVAKLCINDEECSSSVVANKKRGFKKGGDIGSGSSKTGGAKPWKGIGGGGGRHGNEYDPRFSINEDAIMESNSRDLRTTVMIKNIPNKYSQTLLLNMLDNHCIHFNEQIVDGEDDQPLSSYDFIYLPIDFINKCNVGYGFVNMTSPEATLRLYKAFHHQSWEVFNSRKICEVTYARLQGLEALRDHFKNSKFPGDTEEYMPVVFNPPRDGKSLTDPSPISGCCLSDESPSPPSTIDSLEYKNSESEPHVNVMINM